MIVALDKLPKGKSRKYRIRYSHTAAEPTVFDRPRGNYSEFRRSKDAEISTASAEKDLLDIVLRSEQVWFRRIAGPAPTQYPGDTPSISLKRSRPAFGEASGTQNARGWL